MERDREYIREVGSLEATGVLSSRAEDLASSGKTSKSDGVCERLAGNGGAIAIV